MRTLNPKLLINSLLIASVALPFSGCRKADDAEKGEPRPAQGSSPAYEALLAEKAIPDGWQRSGPVKVYVGKKLYDSIDGAADRFFQYAFREQYVANFSSEHPGKSVALEIYDMGAPDDAFGIFSCHDNIMSRHTNVGLAATISEMNLDFCEGKYFVRLLASGFEKDEAEEPLRAFAESIAGNIKPPGALPGLVSRLPGGHIGGTLLFFHTWQTLSERRHVSEENVLGLGGNTSGVLAAYASEERKSDDLTVKVERDIVYLIEYPDKEAAQSARTGYVGHLQKLVKESRAPGQPESELLDLIGLLQEPIELYHLYKGVGERKRLSMILQVFRNHIFGVWEITEEEKGKSLAKAVADNLSR